MTQDEIIRMAVECQLLTTSNRDGLYAQALEAFAKLVVAKEREACAKLVEPNDKQRHDAIHGSHISWVIFKLLERKTDDIRARGEA